MAGEGLLCWQISNADDTCTKTQGRKKDALAGMIQQKRHDESPTGYSVGDLFYLL